jgi:hypothetical protein
MPELPWLRATFAHYAKLNDGTERNELLQTINIELLNNNDPDAVLWRMRLVLNKPYDRVEGNSLGSKARWVPEYEGLGRALGILKSRKFLSQMLWFLEESFKFLAADSLKWVYVRNEIWQIVVPYFAEADLSSTEQVEVLKNLKELMEQYGKNPNIHWFYERINIIERAYLSRQETVTFGDAVKSYLLIRSKQYLDIAYPDEVFSLVKKVINSDLRAWIHQGAYRFIGTVSGLKGEPVRREDLIQKIIVTQLENHLLKRGFRDSDTTLIEPVIFREAQLLDDKRVDLVITYGAIGSVMVEIKRMGNDDLRSNNLVDYKDKFMAYLKQTNCGYGIYFIFLDREDQRRHFTSKLAELNTLYDEHNIEIIGINSLGVATEEE